MFLNFRKRKFRQDSKKIVKNIFYNPDLVKLIPIAYKKKWEKKIIRDEFKKEKDRINNECLKNLLENEYV